MPKILKNSVQWNIRDVYNNTNPYNITYSARRIFENGDKKRVVMPYGLFRKIINTYLKIWIRDFFFAETLYFPIGGQVQKRLYRPETLSKYKINNQKSLPIVMQWFNRELLYFVNYFTLNLNRGSYADFFYREKMKFLNFVDQDKLNIKYWIKKTNRND
jgi:hypothetical protein